MPEPLDAILDGLIEREGGFVDHADDPGRATRWGITEAVARRHGYRGRIRDLPREFAREVYRAIYWERPGFDQVAAVSLPVAEELLDTGVNMGVGVAARFLQRSLNVLNQRGRLFPELVVDGLLGPRSLAALECYLRARPEQGELVLLRALNCLQGARYVELAENNPALETFIFGWLAQRVVIAAGAPGEKA
jgi:lysozyme family protein